MKINRLILQNFQLFKSATFAFDKINIIKGVNLDDEENSANASGKTTILNAISFVLYGCVEGLNLADLISLGEKECSVEVECSIKDETLKIIRKIPSNLSVFINDKEVQANTLKLKQEWLNELLGNYDDYKKYRTIDTKKGINILDLGIVSLRKTLMSFIDDLFTSLRKKLLDKKLERELYNKDKRLYKFHLSERRLNILENGVKQRKEISTEAYEEVDKQYKAINNIKSEITSRERIIYNKRKELEGAQKTGICPVLHTKCNQLTKQITSEQKQKMSDLIEQSSQEIEQFKKQLIDEEDAHRYYKSNYEYAENKKAKTEYFLMKLRESFKFKDYKYSNKDVMLYNESIKILDSFSGYYIKEWLDNLSFIINDLLQKVNLEVTFSIDKDFMTIKNGESNLKYDMLSSGQKIFLGSIFKLAILLQNGETAGLLTIDEGINNLDQINLKKFITILQSLNFQSFLVYQNIEEIENVNKIEIIRQSGESRLK